MRTYICTAPGHYHQGGWNNCLHWCRSYVQNNPDSFVSIYRLRPDMKTATVIAEGSSDGMRFIENGEFQPTKKLIGKYGT